MRSKNTMKLILKISNYTFFFRNFSFSIRKLLLSLSNLLLSVRKFSFFLRSLTKDYTGVRLDSNYQYIDWDWRNMIRGYAGPAVGYIQRKVVSASTKGMRVSLIPKLR